MPLSSINRVGVFIDAMATARKAQERGPGAAGRASLDTLRRQGLVARLPSGAPLRFGVATAALALCLVTVLAWVH